MNTSSVGLARLWAAARGTPGPSEQRAESGEPASTGREMDINAFVGARGRRISELGIILDRLPAPGEPDPLARVGIARYHRWRPAEPPDAHADSKFRPGAGPAPRAARPEAPESRFPEPQARHHAPQGREAVSVQGAAGDELAG